MPQTQYKSFFGSFTIGYTKQDAVRKIIFFYTTNPTNNYVHEQK